MGWIPVLGRDYRGTLCIEWFNKTRLAHRLSFSLELHTRIAIFGENGVYDKSLALQEDFATAPCYVD